MLSADSDRGCTHHLWVEPTETRRRRPSNSLVCVTSIDSRTPPTRRPRIHPAVYALGVFILFTGLAGEAWRHTLGWPGFTVAATLSMVGGILLLAVRRPRVRLAHLPYTFLAFLALCIVSLAWSYYPGATALTLLGQWMGTVSAGALILCLSWAQFLRVLAGAARWVLALSLLFELFVSLVIRQPILPLWSPPHEGKVTLLMLWSRDLLFEGGRIQGIVGNSNILAFVALLGLIVFGLQLWSHAVRPAIGWVWFAVAAVTLALTGSATILAAGLVAAAALGAALLVRHARTPRGRAWLYLVFALVVAVAVSCVLFFSGPLLRLLGRSSDLTGRTEIWDKVAGLAAERPAAGWGFSSPWIPWVQPFDDLWVRHGVQQLQANNAWLDVALQLGVIGVVLLALALLGTVWRSWFFAVDRDRLPSGAPAPYDPVALFPLLLTVVLLVHSLAESTILIQGGWQLLVVVVLGTAVHRRSPAAP